jgi:hypothetical protein
LAFDVTLQAQLVSLRSALDAALTTELDQRQPTTTEQRWAPGEQMSARVEAQLPGGRFHVRVDNLLLEMNLPPEFQPGDTVELEFVTDQPRPSFLLRNPPDTAQRQDVELSRAARNLGEILKAVVPEARNPTTATPVKASAPMLTSPTLDPARLAQALSGALSRSGLFYEAHQSEWVQGQRPLDDLLKEPQARLSAVAREAQTVDAKQTEWAAADAVASDKIQLPSSASSFSSVVQESKPLALPVHPDTLPQVRSQLTALETQQIVWQGQLWPGQDLEWRVQESPERDRSSDEPQPWFTQLRLRLPRLGELTVDLALVGPSLRVRLAASEAQAQQAMQAQREALASALTAAGIDLVSFKVADNGD